MRSLSLVVVVLAMWGCQSEPAPPTRGEFAAVSAGTFRTCAVKTDGTLWCWGNGLLTHRDPDYAFIETPTWQAPPSVTDAPAQVPISVMGAGPFATVSVGLFEICALTDQGRLHCFAPGVTDNVPYPADLGQLWDSVSVGDRSSCGLARDHTATCWGVDTKAQNEVIEIFRYDQPLGDGWSAVSTGSYRNCGIKAAGGVWCWAANSQGTPAQVADGDWRAVGIMGDTVVAIDGDHRLWRVGAGPISDTADWADVEVGVSHACATKLDGSLWCWGNADLGRLGVEPAVSSSAPTQPLAGTWASVSAGGAHTCGVQTDATLWCWGSDGTVGGDQQQPVQASIGQATAVSAGRCHTCATKADGSLWCWGCDDHGQIDASELSAQAPIALGGSTWSSIAAGGSTTCGIKTDGTLWCWGASFDSEYSVPVAVLPPTQIPGTGWSAVSVAFHDACAIRTDHTLWCWGKGILGDGTFSDPATTTPVQVPGTKWASVSVAGDRFELMADGSEAYTCATTTDGELWCWGLVTFPDVTPTISRTPVQLAGVWSSVSVGDDLCAIRSDGTLWCGYGFAAQVPGTGWSSVAVSSSQGRIVNESFYPTDHPDLSCAIKDDHSLWCWPSPVFRDAVPAPVAVPGTWSAVAAGDSACATKLDGSLWCWGPNGFGQLGNAGAWKQTPAQMKF